MTKFKTPFPELDTDNSKVTTIKLVCKSMLYTFAVLGFIFIIVLLSLIGMLKQEVRVTTPVPQNAILRIDLDQKYPETRVDDLLSDIAEVNNQSFHDLLFAINIAAKDKNIKALTASISQTSLGLAQIQELRHTIQNFQAEGKKAYIHSKGFGSFGGGTKEYYAATVFDEIWLQPASEVGITGLAIEVPFFKNVLDKLGVSPEFYTRYEYKNAVASLLSDKFTPEYKAQLTDLGSNLYEYMLMEIAKDRKISTKGLKKLINQAPLFSNKALEKHLIDKIGFEQELVDIVKLEFNGQLVSLDDYSANIKRFRHRNQKIAYMVLEGVITEGESSLNPVKADAIVGAKTVLKQIEDIKADKGIKALVLRINSPGGSYGASNEIWFALRQLKAQRQIPIVVSMGDYAASGGYFVALAGDYIYAEPSTITGSIGVLGGKFVLQELWNKIGINWGEIKFGDNAGMLSLNHRFSEQEKKIFNHSLDNIYQDFITKVSQARDISPKKLDQYARGRVWTGMGAHKRGLIDALGGSDFALGKARDLAGISLTDTFEIVYYPAQKTFAEKLQAALKSRPGVSANIVSQELAIDLNQLNMLKRLQHDAILVPFAIKY